MILYQTRFYTDTVGLSAVAVGTMFLVLRLGDAVLDPLIGALADRTQTRWGKFRPWILGTAVPFGVVFWLVYATPDFGPTGRLVYAYITYSLVMMLYSANNTPYSALMGVMTPDASERSSIASYRFVGALIGQFLIQALPLPLVAKLGAGNSARGWAMTMAIFGGLIIVLNLITFATTRERVLPPPGQKASLREDVKNVFTSRPWVVMFVLTLLVFTMLVVRGSSSNYFFAYYLDQPSVMAFLGTFGLGAAAGEPTGWNAVLDSLGLLVRPDGSNAAAVGLSLFFVLGSLVQIGGIVVSRPLADRFGKKAVFVAGDVRHDPRDRSRVLRGPDPGRPDVLAEHPLGGRLGPDRPASVGDDRRRRGRPLRVADGPARDRVHVRGHSLRAEGRPEPGRRPERLDRQPVRVHPQRGAVEDGSASAFVSGRASTLR